MSMGRDKERQREREFDREREIETNRENIVYMCVTKRKLKYFVCIFLHIFFHVLVLLYCFSVVAVIVVV